MKLLNYIKEVIYSLLETTILANQYLLLLQNTACLAAKQYMLILDLIVFELNRQGDESMMIYNTSVEHISHNTPDGVSLDDSDHKE
jgi:peptide deformylase